MNLTLPWLKNTRVKPGRLGIAFGPDGVAVAHVDQRQLRWHRFYEHPGDPAELFQQLVDEQGWQGLPCSLVLHPVYYQLLLTDSPAVAEEEMAEAIRWKIKDLLDFAPEQGAIDFFKLPADAYRGRQKMLYVAALQKQTLQSLVTPIEEAGLQLDCVEVSELAVHNLVSGLPHEAGGFAVLQLFGAEGFVSMVEDGQIYLTRGIEIGLDEFLSGSDPQRFLDNLMLELQRSLDFYESQLGKGIITDLYFSPGTPVTVAIVDYLSQQLALNVAPLAISTLIDGDLQEQAGQCLTAIGAALGPEQQAAAMEVDDAAH
jgi:MSHA biogenesis protein MshI